MPNSDSAATAPVRKRKVGEKQRIAKLLENVARGGCPCGGKFKWLRALEWIEARAT